MELNRFLSKRVPILLNSIRSVCEVSAAAESQEDITVCSSKGQALQLTSGLDFLSIQTEAVMDGASIEGEGEGAADDED
jgi:hypothetical protein